MNMTFNDLVNNIRNLSLPEKLEVKDLLEKSIVEQRRSEIHDNFFKSRKEYKEKKLKFASDISRLRKMID